MNETELAYAVEIARAADVAVIAIGDTPQQVGEWKDRSTLDLQPSQLTLLQALTNQSTGTRIVVVLIHGNQVRDFLFTLSFR